MLHPADSNPPDTDPNARATNEKRGVSSALFESLPRTNFAPAPSELAQFPREETNSAKPAESNSCRCGSCRSAREGRLFGVVLRGSVGDGVPFDAEVVGQMAQVTDQIGDRALEVVVRLASLAIRNEGGTTLRASRLFSYLFPRCSVADIFFRCATWLLGTLSVISTRAEVARRSLSCSSTSKRSAESCRSTPTISSTRRRR